MLIRSGKSIASLIALSLLGCAPAIPSGSESGTSSSGQGTSSASAVSGSDGDSSGDGSTGATSGEESAGSGPVDPECGAGVHEGNLIITDGTSLAETAGITHVQGHVEVEGTASMTDLGLLADLRCVDGSLRIDENSALESLDGLGRLERVGEIVGVSANPMLQHVDGLDGVRELAGLSVENNSSLAELPTFPLGVVFRQVDDDGALLSIRNNGLVDLDDLLAIESLTIDGERIRIWITADPQLESIAGVAAFAQIDTEIELHLDPVGVPVMTDVDLSGFEELEALYLVGWPGLTSISAPDLHTAGTLYVAGTHDMTDLAGLPQLEQVGSLELGCDMAIESGGAFESFAGLDAVASAGRVVISTLPALMSLDGLSTSMELTSLTIRGNPQLPTADAEAFAAAVSPEEIDICGNAGARPCGAAMCLAIE